MVPSGGMIRLDLGSHSFNYRVVGVANEASLSPRRFDAWFLPLLKGRSRAAKRTHRDPPVSVASVRGLPDSRSYPTPPPGVTGSCNFRAEAFFGSIYERFRETASSAPGTR